LSLAGHRRFRGALQIARLALLAASGLALVGPVPALAGTPAPPQPLTPTPPNPGTSTRIAVEPRVLRPGAISGFQLPFEVGTSATIEQGWNTSFSHNGKAAFAYDFAVPLGTPIVVAAAGVVSYVHDGETKCGGAELLKKANLVVIDHADGSATQYGHLSTIGVKEGQAVAAGQQIGTSGDTGYSQCLPHLHFARQFLDGVVTQSVPVYFEGYPGREFHDGDVVTPPPAACGAPAAAAEASGKAADQPPRKAAQQPPAKAADQPPLGVFCGRYSSAAPGPPQSFVREDEALSFDWRTRGPGAYWLDEAGVSFAARWVGRFDFDATGTYVIHVSSSESVTVTIDGIPLAAHPGTGQPGDIAPRFEIAAGTHLVVVDYESAAGQDQLLVEWHLARPAARFDDL
jgi:hypothetical protein